MAKIVTVTLDEDNGNISLDLTGFKGKGCDAIVKLFGELGKVKKTITKPEYSQTTSNTVTR